jgi:hypothetical protein
MVHGVAQNVLQGENLNNYKVVSENLGRAKKNLWFSKTNNFFLYYQIQRNFTLFICSSWPLNRKLVTERPTEGNVSYFGEQFVLLPG